MHDHDPYIADIIILTQEMPSHKYKVDFSCTSLFHFALILDKRTNVLYNDPRSRPAATRAGRGVDLTGLLCLLYRDLTSGRWFLARVYD